MMGLGELWVRRGSSGSEWCILCVGERCFLTFATGGWFLGTIYIEKCLVSVSHKSPLGDC